MAQLLAPTFITAIDANGDPISGATLTFYLTGTTTLTTVYANSTLATPLANPLTADSAGRFAPVYLSPSVTYRAILKDASGTTIKDVDPISFSAAGLNFLQAGSGAVSRSVESKLRDVLSVKDFGAVGDGVTDDTAAIQAANTAAVAATRALYFPAGTYKYAPAARIDIDTKWVGESVYDTIIEVSASYASSVFRLTGSDAIEDLWIRQAGYPKTSGSTGLQLAATATADFTGHMRLSRVWVQGFDVNIDVFNTFHVTFDQVRSDLGAIGVRCAPTDTAADDGYSNTHLHLNCHYTENNQNLHYITPVQSHVVIFVGGSQERNASTKSQFTRIRQLHFAGHYFEGSSTRIAASFDDCSVSFEAIYLNDTGGLELTGNTEATIKGLRANTATDVLTCTGGTQRLTMIDCQWPASGNTFASLRATLIDVTINGTTYGNNGTEIQSHTGARLHRQQTTVSGASATDVYRFLDIDGDVQVNGQAGQLFVQAADQSNGANQATYVYDLVGCSNGTSDITLTQVRRQLRGTDPGNAANPLSLAADGSGGVKIQFTKNAAIANVVVRAVFVGLSY